MGSRSYYDDNFGHWEIEDHDDVDFYWEVQAESVERQCSGCGKTRRLRPGTICNSCADIVERGGDLPAWEE